MTVQVVNKAQSYTGLAADTKPLDSNVVAGSTFTETDTGIEYVYDGSAWVILFDRASNTIDVAPVCDISGVYASGDVIGGKLTLSDVAKLSGGVGTIMSIAIADKAKQNAALDIVIFNGEPGSFTDQAPFDPSDADLLKMAGVISILASDYASFNDNSLATLAAIGLGFNVDSGDDLFAAVVSRGTPTYVSTSDLQIRLGVVQD